MHYTILCSFHSHSGWRVHRILNVQTHSISVVTQGSMKLLSIPVVAKMHAGQFCNPAKLLMQVVRQTQVIIRRTPMQLSIEESPVHDPEIALRRIRAACEAVKF